MLCLAALAACAPPAFAQTKTQAPIYRCVGAHGEPEFSGKPCGSEMVVPAGAATAQGAGTGLGHVCAASPQELRDAIAAAFESRDVNRLAGLILWRGIDQGAARARLRSLGDWLKQPLAGIAVAYSNGPPVVDAGPAHVFSAGPGSGAPVSALPASGFEVSTAGGDVRDFGIVESDGCWWLTFD
jgi:hypothetical protein